MPHSVKKLSSNHASADENFYDHNMGSIDPPDGPMPTAPPGRPPVPGIPPPQQTVADPAEAAALSEMLRLRTQLASASSYGAGVNAKGQPCRKRWNSRRPSDVLPEAWANMGDAQRERLEEDMAARRQLLRSQISNLEKAHPLLDFQKMLKTTSSGQVGLICERSEYKFSWDESCISSDANTETTFGAAAHATSFSGLRAAFNDSTNSTNLDQQNFMEETSEHSQILTDIYGSNSTRGKCFLHVVS